MRPPRLAGLLVRFTVPAEDRGHVLADLERGWLRVRKARGAGAAWRWYWWQALRGVAEAARPDVPRLGFGHGGAYGADLRLALRSLRRRPVYATGSVGALALGLASAASVFSVAWNVWLAPLPVPRAHEVARIFELEQAPPGAATEGTVRERLALSPPLLEDLRSHDWTAIQAVAGVSQDRSDWNQGGTTRRLATLRVSPEAGVVLGLTPLAGRFLDDDDASAGVVLTEGFWRREFGGDPSVVGREVLDLDGAAHPVVGVVRLPEGYPAPADALVRLRFDEASLSEGWRGARYLDGVARLRPGHTPVDASRELDAFISGLGDAHPQHRGRGGVAVELGEELSAPYRGVLTLLLVAGGVFLLLAAVNVTGLVLIRRAQDRHERGVRAALGATARRLLAGTVAETSLVGASAGALGVLLTHWVLTPLVALAPVRAPRIDQVGLDGPLALGIVAGGILVGVVVGVVAHAGSRPGLAVGRSPSAAAGGGLRAFLVGQVALTTLLAAAGVGVLRHVRGLQAVDLGFEPRGVQARLVTLSEARHPSDEALRGAWDGILEGLAARGIEAAVAGNPPVAGVTMRYGYRVPGRSEEQEHAQYHAVTPGYLDIMGIRLLAGRDVADADEAGTAPVVVVNEALARRHFPDEDPLGRTLLLVGTERRIVGVAASTRHFGPGSAPPDEVYVPLAQDPRPAFGYVLLKTPLPDAASLLQDVLAGVDPTLEPQPTLPFTHHVSSWYAPLTLQLAVVAALGLVGLLLVATGLYAQLAYQVSLRRREIGIRKALGAPVAGLFRKVVGEGVALAGAGLLLGLAAWLALTPLAAGLVLGLDRGDGWVPLLVACVVGTVAVLATVAPAWRSSAVDPLVALQSE